MHDSYSVYMHTCPKNKKYIGVTLQKPELRWRGGRGYQRNPYFYKVIMKVGWGNIAHDILFSGLTKEAAEAKEIELIAKHLTNSKRYGYNLEKGGNVKGKCSLESRMKMSLASTGKKHSEETRLKISKGGKGLKKGKEFGEKLSLRQTGDGNHRYGKVSHNAKKVAQLSLAGETIAHYSSSYEAEKMTGAESRSIRSVCAGDRKTCGGYGWVFV